MNPPDRRQEWEAPSHSYSNWTFIPTTISPLSEDKKVILSSQWLIYRLTEYFASPSYFTENDESLWLQIYVFILSNI